MKPQSRTGEGGFRTLSQGNNKQNCVYSGGYSVDYCTFTQISLTSLEDGAVLTVAQPTFKHFKAGIMRMSTVPCYSAWLSAGIPSIFVF